MIDSTRFLLFLTAAILLAIAPGPGMIYVLARTLAGGRREGFSSFGSYDPDKERIVDQAIAKGRAATAASTGAETIGLRVGDDVRHAKFGEGVILLLEGNGDKAEAVVRFADIGEKRLLLAWSPLQKV